jgi:hypothetical protein
MRTTFIKKKSVEETDTIIDGHGFARERSKGPGAPYELWPIKADPTRTFISVDVESNGLHGKPYAVAMIVYRDGKRGESIKLFCDPERPLDEWLQNNPHLLNIPNAAHCASYLEMMTLAAQFYCEQAPMLKPASEDHHSGYIYPAVMAKNPWGGLDYQTVPVLYHCGMVVEGNFFRELVALKLIGAFDAPMAPIDVAEHLRCNGFDPHSVDTYLQRCGVAPATGAAHDPEFDAVQAATAYLLLVGK